MILVNAAWQSAPALRKRVVEAWLQGPSVQFELEPRAQRHGRGAGRTGVTSASGGCLC
jgi:hypothetical protein